MNETEKLTDLANALAEQRNAIANQLAHAQAEIASLNRKLEAMRVQLVAAVKEPPVKPQANGAIVEAEVVAPPA